MANWAYNPDPKPRGRVFKARVAGGWVATASDWMPEYGMRSLRTYAGRAFDTFPEAYQYAASLTKESRA